MELPAADLVLVGVRFVAQELVEERLRDGNDELITAAGKTACAEPRLIVGS